MTPSITAVHEAGHATNAQHYGLSVGILRLTPGHSVYSGYFMSADFRKASPLEWATVLLGGKAAMRECCRDLPREVLDYSGRTDRAQAIELLSLCADTPAESAATLQQAERMAWYLANKHRDLIIAVARELDRRGVLDGAEFREIVMAHQTEATQ